MKKQAYKPGTGDPRFLFNAIDSILTHVREGLGATILSRTLLEQENDGELDMIEIDKPICCEIGIVDHKDKYMGSAAQAYMRLLMEHCAAFTGNQERSA
ncbi:LysR family transcriptional regulator substrate-binding protein [Brevibacillus fluminis]|uniref:LysR family transcriptional regulator substrate-binding protein n=1 Tax=Brevibacillus fluminis TaxID=511487 RepID=UPI0024823901|nr:LysR family transcriptional regulator substrate-binding protein [Brevibacillus fluminis]